MDVSKSLSGRRKVYKRVPTSAYAELETFAPDKLHIQILKKQLNIMQYPIFSDEFFMNEALKEAQIAFEKDEIPVGAIVVIDKQIVGRGHNLTETLQDTTAHAEMQAITAASQFLGAKYLTNATLFVTLEPCVMCAGAMFWSKISRLVYAATDQKQGFSKINKNNSLPKNLILHPKTKINTGILSEKSEILLKKFFKNKRKV